MIRWERRMVVAALTLAAAALTFGYAIVRAVTLDAVRATTETRTSKDNKETPAAGAAAKQALSREDLMLAVDHDPFQADRQRPPERYRLPGEEVPMEEPPPPPPPPAPPFRVLGTIVTNDGGVAVIESQGAVSRVVGVGETLFGFKLTAVNNSTATVEGNGGHAYSLTIDQPAMARTTGRAGRGTRTPQDAMRQQVAEREAQLRDLLERARGNGATPGQMDQMVQEMLRRNFPNAQGFGGVEGGRGPNGQQQIIIRPRPDTLRDSAPVPERRR